MPTSPALSRREQRTVDSRARILQAAVDCLVEQGYAGATTLAIQARAGVSRGRLLHHFPSREELLVAAAEHLASERVRQARERIDGSLTGAMPSGTRIARVVELMWLTFHESHFWASVELWTAARTDPVIAAALLPGERKLGAVIRETVDGMLGPDLAGRPRYPLVRELLLTSMRGVALTYAFDRRDPRRDPHISQWVDTARTLLDA